MLAGGMSTAAKAEENGCRIHSRAVGGGSKLVAESASAERLPAQKAAPALHAHTPQSWVLWAIAVAAIGVVTGSMVLALASDQLDRPGLRAFLIGWIVIPYVVSGILAWWRRPASRQGPLMLATGFVMALTPMQWSNQPLVYSVGHLLDMLPAAMFLHVFLAFPTGRLNRTPERILVIACYAAALGLQILKIILGVNPDSIFSVFGNVAAGNVVERIQLSFVSACLLAGTVRLYVRARAPGRRRRRPAALVVDAFGLSLVMLALLYMAGLGSWQSFETIRLITFAALGLAPIAFLIALLDARLARGDVAGLLVELRANPTADLQVALGRALRDPSVRLAYWLPQRGTWVDQDGKPIPSPMPDERRAVRTVKRGEQPMAAVIFDRSLEDEHELLDAVAAAAGIALENGQLQAELRARLQELHGSRVRVLEAGRRERKRLERDLHDGAQQRLVALSLELSFLGESPAADPELRERLERAKDAVAASLEELRDVARGIYPAVLSGHGLPVALESLAARASVPVELVMGLNGRQPEAAEVAAYYVVSEALTNIDKHAAASAATVRLSRIADALVVDVTDNGVGGADPRDGSGLRGLADRVEALGGELRTESVATGGTCVHAEIPCR
jgi:signal transduction histidine kinase